jgi:hypothetical protein
MFVWANIKYYVLVVIVILLQTTPASAQTVKPKPKTMGELLLEEADKLMLRQNFKDACPKLEEVARLVPNGIGTRQALGDCYVGLAQPARAWAQYNYAHMLAVSKGDPRAAELRQAITELTPRLNNLPTVAIQVPQATRNVAGLSLTWDAIPQDTSTSRLLIPVDQGTHIIEATAPGRQTWNRPVRISSNSRQVAVVVEELPKAQAVSKMNKPPTRMRVFARPAESTARSTWFQPLGYLSLGVGVVGLAAGSTVLGYSFAANGLGTDRRDELATTAVVTMSIAATLVAGGVLLLVLPSKNKAASDDSSGRIQWRGGLGLHGVGLQAIW